MVPAAPFERIARRIERRASALKVGETTSVWLSVMDRFHLLGYSPTALSFKNQVSRHLDKAQIEAVNISKDRSRIEFIIGRKAGT